MNEKPGVQEAIERLEAGACLLDVDEGMQMALRILDIARMDGPIPVRLKVYGALNVLQTFLLMAEAGGADRACVLADLIRHLEEWGPEKKTGDLGT